MSIFDLLNEPERPAHTATVMGGAVVAAGAFESARTEPTPGFVLPVEPATKTLFGYQVAAAETALVHGRVVLGFAPGMGKTAIAQAVVAAKAAQGIRSIVVVPPTLRLTPWAQDFAADYPHLRVEVVTGTKAGLIPAADVVIVGDSTIHARQGDLIAFGAGLVIGDEAHRYKSRTAKRSVAFTNIADAAADVITMTGTLAVNRPDEVYQPLRATGTRRATQVSGGASWTAFRSAWCITEPLYIPSLGRTIEKVVGCKDAQGLNRKMAETCYVRIEREDVLDLPNKGWSVRSLVLNGAMKDYRRAERDFIAHIRDTKGGAAARKAAKAEAIVEMMGLWKMAGEAKVAATVEYVVDFTDQGEQVVVMAWHTEVIDAIVAGLTKEGVSSVAVKGGMGDVKKAAAQAAFQSGQVPVLVGQIEAAGVGITLHKAANLVFAQLPWSPGSLQQAADRIYRIGQHRDVVLHVLNADASIDEVMWAVLIEKAKVVDAINAGQPVTIDEETVTEAVLAHYGW